MSKKKKDQAIPEGRKFYLPIVQKLDELTMVGIYDEILEDKDYLEPLYRLRIESKDLDDVGGDPILCPWTSAQVLTNWIQGALFLQPLLLKVIRERQANAEPPKEN